MNLLISRWLSLRPTASTKPAIGTIVVRESRRELSKSVPCSQATYPSFTSWHHPSRQKEISHTLAVSSCQRLSHQPKPFHGRSASTAFSAARTAPPAPSECTTLEALIPDFSDAACCCGTGSAISPERSTLFPFKRYMLAVVDIRLMDGLVVKEEVSVKRCYEVAPLAQKVSSSSAEMALHPELQTATSE